MVIKRSTIGKKNDVERKSVSSIKFILAFLKNGCFPWPHFSTVFDHVHKFKLVSHSFEVNGAACTSAAQVRKYLAKSGPMILKARSPSLHHCRDAVSQTNFSFMPSAPTRKERGREEAHEQWSDYSQLL